VVGEDNAGNGQSPRDGNLKRITFDLTGDRTEERQLDLGVISMRRKNNRRPPARLFAAGLRI